jgi:AraC family transcriptional regulator
MQAYGKGILPQSQIYMYAMSDMAKQLYFYPLCTGHYYCDCRYIVERQSFNSYLMIYVLHGDGYCRINGKRQVLHKGMFALLDCYQPHCYGTDTDWEILWVHFDGPLARKYYSLVFKMDDVGPRDSDTARRYLERVCNASLNGKISQDAELSKYIVSMLTEFLIVHETDDPLGQVNIEEIRSYMAENLAKPLSLDNLAQRANLSPFYFTRLFKQKIGYTPHEYLILVRTNAAKYYLKATSLTIKEIAYRCGFSSECSFCTSFKKNTGQTPSGYRLGIDGSNEQ